MKKSVVALLIVLAVVVLVSPAIVGKLAERSMDESLDWAATESQELVVTSQGFDRGWFSSEGQHRVEVRAGELQDILLSLSASDDPTEIPALIIDTRLDHGLIPVASMTRDEGTLMPGLGSAVSTMSIELADGSTVPLPGTIYSEVGLTGELRSNFVVEAGSHEFEEGSAIWGATAIEVATDPSSGAVAFDGDVTSIALSGDGILVGMSGITFNGEQRKSRFGFSVGDANLTMQAMTVETGLDDSETMGPMVVHTDVEIDSDRVNGRSKFTLDNAQLPMLGGADIAIDASIVDADAAALANVLDALENVDPDDFMFVAQNDLQQLFTKGFEFRVDQLDFALSQGTATSNLKFSVDSSDPDNFAWPSVLLALDASAEVSIPAEVVDLLTTIEPQFHAVIAGGFLRKNGDVYEMETEFKKGLLTVNGAPMPLPIPGMQ